MKKNILKNLNRFLLFLCFFFFASETQAQTKVVRGIVTTLDGLTVGNVEVKAKKANSSVTTNTDGSFEIVCNTKDVLSFNGRVFETKKYKINKKINEVTVLLDFIQTPENIEYAIGYGYISDKERLNAAVQASSENGFCNFSKMSDLIKALFPGFSVNEDCVIIRGTNSINSSSCALIIIDDRIVDSYSYLSPCDVKSIDAIKDSGSAIYGARGANGVILITLK